MSTPKKGQTWINEGKRVKITRTTRHQVWFDCADGGKGWAMIRWFQENFCQVKRAPQK
ncbi:hypothetical protein [Prosthecobacter vanneervenii]|uniref:Uncharacterized protein n=1 Tax=Prosthecobacter vanneervenii TaxID=48466 RepID=A0A7W8DKD8_9BACT|nr:hypothetical protein [Prosthecobacter vanneervenii]MBB5033139.1 hypothetical protein [Prosthecobacter vanneervenii]